MDLKKQYGQGLLYEGNVFSNYNNFLYVLWHTENWQTRG